jgi:hypothetical protein
MKNKYYIPLLNSRYNLMFGKKKWNIIFFFWPPKKSSEFGRKWWSEAESSGYWLPMVDSGGCWWQ